MSERGSPIRPITFATPDQNAAITFPHNTLPAMTSGSRNVLHGGGSGNGGGGNGGDILVSEFRKVHLPSFWQKSPRLWFAQLESEFTFYRISSDNVKYSAIVRHLDEQTMLAVADVIERPPDAEKYQTLKDMLIARFTDSEERRLRLLIAGVELGDKRPSEMLRELKQLSGGCVTDNILQTLWLQRLPSRVQETLAVVEGVSLEKLAELADKVTDRNSNAMIAAVEAQPSQQSQVLADLVKKVEALTVQQRKSRSRSRHRSKSRQRKDSKDKSDSEKGLCFYHKRFGAKARRCTRPCTAEKTLAIKEN